MIVIGESSSVLRLRFLLQREPPPRLAARYAGRCSCLR
jgi:hypothetical protein